MKLLAAVCLLAGSVAFAQTPFEDAIEAARGGPNAPGLKERLARVQPNGQGVTVWGQDYLFLVNSPSAVTVSINQQPPTALTQVPGSNLWMLLTKMRTGVLHSYQFFAAGKPLGARGDAVGYNPDSYAKPGVPKGKVTREAHLRQQDLRRHEGRLLGLRVAGSGPERPRAADGLAGRAGV